MARSCRYRPSSRFAGIAMTPPHSWCEKKRLDCRSRPTRFRAGIDPRLLSADSEPRSRTAESRRCGRSERRTPDDPADSSPNRDEMLHRFGADPRARRTCPRGRGGQHRGMLRSRGCCFATRNLTLRRRRRILLLLERAGTRMLACCSCHRVSTCFGEARRQHAATMKGLAIGES
jgi:hypothetical protein